MREAVFILLVILVLLALTAFRYRRQIGAVVNFWRTIQTMRQPGREQPPTIRDAPAAVGQLVNCPKCGTWVPEDKAIRLGRSAFYCSTKCLDASVKNA